MEEKLNLLKNPEIIKWCYDGITEISLKNTYEEKKLKESKNIEKSWGNKILNREDEKITNQWTTELCELLAMEALLILGRKNVRKTKGVQSSVREKKYCPDLECDEYVYEVKGRNWCTPGTAGEKILGVPLKYGELPRLFKKPLQIILVGYQEYEARQNFGFGDLLNEKIQTPELRESLAFYKEHNIEYVGFTDILEKINIRK